MNLNCLFLDFDSYFASVEQALNPRLWNKPVAIIPMQAETTVCIAASYEAKAFGVKTGTAVHDARRLCPGIRLILARPAVYVEFHHQMVKAVNSCLPVTEVASVDEMACQLTGRWRDEEEALKLAHQVKRAVAEVAAVGASIGIGPNRFLAKMASKLDKPNGLRVIYTERACEALKHLELEDLTGIAGNMRARLEQVGINTVEQLYQAERRTLRQVWGGIEGERFHDDIHGRQTYRPPTQRGSVGHSHVLPPHRRDEAAAYAILQKLVQKAAVRLRRLEHHAAGMVLDLRYFGGAYWSEYRRFAATQSTQSFSHVLNQLWQLRPKVQYKLLGVSVTLVNLIPSEGCTADLFEQYQQQRKPVDQVLDAVNKKFGPHSLFLGGACGTQQDAPMRISFTQIPDLDTERDVSS